jgi:hypothetical protein
MRNAYLHGSGRWTNDLISASRHGLLRAGTDYAVPTPYDLARIERDKGVRFMPASVGHMVRVPLDNESRISLNTILFGTYLSIIPRDYYNLRIGVVDDDNVYKRILFTYDEVLLLGTWAMYYMTQLSEHADSIVWNQIPITDPWPSNKIPDDFTMWPGNPEPPARRG